MVPGNNANNFSGYSQPLVNINAGQQPYGYNYGQFPNTNPQPNTDAPFFCCYANGINQARNILPNPPERNSSIAIDGEAMKMYQLSHDGVWKCFKLVEEDIPSDEPVTLDAIARLLDQKMDEKLSMRLTDFENSLSEKFVIRKDNYRNNQNRGGNPNG